MAGRVCLSITGLVDSALKFAIGDWLRIISFSLVARDSPYNAHQEAVELRLRQRVRAMVLDRVLRRQHHERRRQRVRVVIHGDLRFVHRFQERRLGLRGGAVDFVGDDDIGEDRAGLEFEALRGRVEYADADDVAGQQVGWNWMRWKVQWNERASGMREGRLPTPGTSSISRWPRASR